MKMMNIPYNNYKTQSCKYFDQEGQCKFGKNCSYAHGGHELRNPYDNLPIMPPQIANPFMMGQMPMGNEMMGQQMRTGEMGST